MKYLWIGFFCITFGTSFAQEKGNWKKFESPGLLINQDYEQNFNKLPLNARLQKRPWSDTYWATYRGGLAVRWAQKTPDYGFKLLSKEELATADIASLSPSEKWDLYMGDSTWSLTNLERERTQILKTVPNSPVYDKKFQIPKWFGLCHAWAPATILYDAPGPLTVSNGQGIEIPFYASDIKALLTYNLHVQGDNTKTYFMGSRCNVTLPKLLKKLSFGKLTEEKYISLVRKEECNDMDAGATHLALANMIGVRKIGFVMDMTRGSEVWNQAIYSYSSKILKTETPKKKRNHDPILGVSKILTLRTDLVYITEINANREGQNFPKGSLKDVVYNYEVHLNDSGEIIGGKWLDALRPDFFWRIDDPGFHPGFQYLNDIYLASTKKAPYEPRIYSKQQIKTLFKDTAQKVKLANRFIKNSAELAQIRRENRMEYYNNIKNEFLTNYNNLLNLFK